jgi:hypothetical protein
LPKEGEFDEKRLAARMTTITINDDEHVKCVTNPLGEQLPNNTASPGLESTPRWRRGPRCNRSSQCHIADTDSNVLPTRYTGLTTSGKCEDEEFVGGEKKLGI